MKRSLTLFVAAGCAICAWSQTPQKPASSSAPAVAAEAASPKGPEAIAEKEPNKVVATINGQQITAKQAYDLLQMIPAEQRKTAPNLEKLFEQLYTLNALANDAEKEHMDQDPAVKSQIELSRDNVLAQAYMKRLTATQEGPPADPKQYYDSHKDEFNTAKLSGIAIAFNPPGTPAKANGPNRTEQEAQSKADDLEKKIKAGADITTLARTDSDDQRSATSGGNLGTLSAAQPGVPENLKEQVFQKLQPGQVSEPIRLPNAYYIIKLDSRTQEPFDQVRNTIEQKLKGEKEQAIVQQEIGKYKVQVQDAAFFDTGAKAANNAVPSLGAPIGHAPSAQNGASHATTAQSNTPK